MKTRYDRGDIRRLNAVSVLSQLRSRGPLSRAHLADRLGLTRATVSNIVSDLIAVSLVRESAYEVGGVGRRGRLLDLNPSCGALIAVELDIDRVVVALANVGLEYLWRGESPLSSRISSSEGLERAAVLVEEAMRRSAKLGLRCLGIGVAWAGLVNRESGQLAYGPILGWEEVPLRSDWEARFGVSVYVENEAHAGAIAAHHFGAPRGVDDLVYLSLGVGLSAGVYVDGALLRGKQGYAGQVGHTPFLAGGHPCGCGRRGCWVTEIGAAGVLRKLKAAGLEFPEAANGGLGWIEPVCRLSGQGDKRVLAVMDEFGRQVGEGLAQLAQVVNPSHIFLGGHLRELLELCQGRIYETLQATALPPVGKGLTVVVNASGQDQLMGCLATALDALMKDPSLESV